MDPGRPAGGAPPPSQGQLTLLEVILAVLLLAGVFCLSRYIATGRRSKIYPGGSSAIASLKTLVTMEEQYKTTAGNGVYETLTDLSAASPPYVDFVLAKGKKSGYTFVLTVGTPADTNYLVSARPVTPGTPGRTFFVDSSGVIRFRLWLLATSGDSEIE